MTTIKSSTTTTTAYSVTADTTGTLVIQTGATPTTAVTIGTDQSVTFAQAANLPNTFGFKNRLINGSMVIDQRNAGASVTQTTSGSLFSVDRWQIYGTVTSKFTAQQNAGSLSAANRPAGFTNYLGITSSSAYSSVAGDQFVTVQNIEGFNAADLGWGTANAQAVTISFWVRSSLTGSFGGAVANIGFNRSYPFGFTISAANTWEQKTVTIAGDTSGTWATDNTTGIRLYFNLGSGSTYLGTANTWAGALYVAPTGATSVVGTNGATFYITGVQLEKGSTATSFDYRPYGTELALCQRYFYKWLNDAGYTAYVTTLQPYSTTAAFGKILDFPVTMRTTPACVTSGTFGASNSTGGTSIAFTTTVIDYPTKNSVATGGWTGSSGLVAGNASVISIANNGFISASAEL